MDNKKGGISKSAWAILMFGIVIVVIVFLMMLSPDFKQNLFGLAHAVWGK